MPACYRPGLISFFKSFFRWPALRRAIAILAAVIFLFWSNVAPAQPVVNGGLDTALDSIAGLVAQGLRTQGYTANFGEAGTGIQGTGVTSNAPPNVQWDTWNNVNLNISVDATVPLKGAFYNTKFVPLGKPAGATNSFVTGISSKDANGDFTVVEYAFATASSPDAIGAVLKGRLASLDNDTWTFSGIPAPLGNFPVGTASTAFTCISASGTVGAGNYFVGGAFHPFYIGLPVGNGIPLGLPSPPGLNNGTVTGISADGTVIVGDYLISPGTDPTNATFGVYNYNQTLRNYAVRGIPKASGSVATRSIGISGDGNTVVGYHVMPNGSNQPMRWDAPNGYRNLGLDAQLNPINGRATATTTDGSKTVGIGIIPDGRRAFVTNPITGTVTVLPILTGQATAAAQCVSGDGAFVGGASYGPSLTTPTAVIWTSSGTVYNLQGLLTAMGSDLTGWALNLVTAIVKNSDGTYLFAGNGTRNGVAGGWVFQLGDSSPPLAIAAQPRAQRVGAGGNAFFGVTAVGLNSYQWQRNGVNVPGATRDTLLIANAQIANAGSYTCRVSNATGTITTVPAALTVLTSVARLSNLSVRSTAGTGANTLIVGLTIADGTKQILLRAVGPTLGVFGVPGTLADPQLALFNSGGTQIAQNNDWGGGGTLTNAFANVGAFALPAASKDAALLSTFVPGGYSAQVSGAAGTTGVVLVESYDSDPGSPFARYTNLSARNQVGTGANILIVGFNITGNGPLNLLLRGVGPTLGQFGVAGTLADPQLALFNATGTQIAQNDDWGGGGALTNAFTSVGAFPLSANSKDAALSLTLPPGSYTAQLSGVAATTGVALVEIYELP